MKEKIIEIIGFGIEPERAELKAVQIIVLFNKRIVEKLKEDKYVTLTDLISKIFIEL